MNENYYVIPDIHGCSKLLKQALDFVHNENPQGGKIIFLGDYIDRGPDNVGVLELVMKPPEGWEYICLKGNHEAMFVDSYLNQTRFYDQTAAFDLAGIARDPRVSYEELHSGIDQSIIQWMDNLPIFHIEDKNVFAHAYYDDTLGKENQVESRCLWERLPDSEKYFNENQGFFLTHGHTPRKNGPVFAPNRVNLDAGAVFYGVLLMAEYHKNRRGPVLVLEFYNK